MKLFSNILASRLGKAVLTLSAICFASVSASAGFYNTTLNNGAVVYLTGAHGSAGGGEFVVKASAVGAEYFRTFCVEENENISIPNTVTFGSTTLGRVGLDFISDMSKPSVTNPLVSVAAMQGIVSNVINTAGMANELTYGAAALYKAFASGYDSVGGGLPLSILGETYNATNADQNLLQQAIWFFQRQNSVYSNMTLAAIQASNKYIKAVTTASSLNIAGVSVLNLTDVGPTGRPRNVQSMLYWDGTPGTSNAVPEPASLAMWLSVVGLGAYARRRRSMVS